MAFSVTNTFAATETVEAAEVNENFDDIESLLNGSLTTANLSSSAGITNSQLANSNYEMLVKLQIRATDAATLPPAGQALVDFFPLPDLATDGPYTILDADYYMTAQGSSGSTSVTIASGTVSAGAFSATTTHVNAQTIASGTAANDIVGSFALSTAVIPASANNRVLRMIVTLATGALPAIGDSLTVTLKLRRTNGLRGT